jgi:hypothetical protein
MGIVLRLLLGLRLRLLPVRSLGQLHIFRQIIVDSLSEEEEGLHEVAVIE